MPEKLTRTLRKIVSMQDEQAPRITWEQFLRVFKWRQGEHVAYIGPTGSGKTTLALGLLTLRKYIVVLATKPRDTTLDKFAKDTGFVTRKEWKKEPHQLHPRRIIWPDASRMDSVVKQRKEFKATLDAIYREGGWCVYIDELWYIIHHLKLQLEVKTYLQQARSLGISLVVGTQRPAFVPLEVYDQSTHLFFWRDNDESNLKRLSGISWRSANVVRSLVAELDLHEVLYINTRTGKMYRTKMEL